MSLTLSTSRCAEGKQLLVMEIGHMEEIHSSRRVPCTECQGTVKKIYIEQKTSSDKQTDSSTRSITHRRYIG